MSGESSTLPGGSSPVVEIPEDRAPAHKKDEPIDISSGDESFVTEPEEIDLDEINILYCCCGESRKGDVKHCLEELARAVGNQRRQFWSPRSTYAEVETPMTSLTKLY